MLAGFMFGALAVLIQAVITQVTIASYGASRIDSGYAVLSQPGALIPFTLMGSPFGVLYTAARARLRTPAVPTALGFAVLVVLILQPLLLSTQLDFSAHVDVTQIVAAPAPGFPDKAFVTAQDVSPPVLLGSILAALLWLEGLAITLVAVPVGRLLPRLPAAAYGFIAAAPGLTLVGLLLLVVALLSGSE